MLNLIPRVAAARRLLPCSRQLYVNVRPSLAQTRFAALETARNIPHDLQRAHFSSRVGSEGSDSDFAPESKVKTDPNDEDGMQQFLKTAVENHDVLLFMKGSPEAPQCGFSMKVSQILKGENVDFSSADVLASPEVREGIKKFSDWPTIPQLYVQGEFVGGCDIVTDMYENGELTELLAPIKSKQAEERKQEK